MGYFTETTQFKKGKQTEYQIAEYLINNNWSVVPTTEQEERYCYLGDLIARRNNVEVYIEVKSDEKSLYTGNFYIEIVSVDTDNTPGWSLTTRADYVFTKAGNKIYVFTPECLRAKIDEWRNTYTVAGTGDQNKYRSFGILVPVKTMEAFCESIIKLV